MSGLQGRAVVNTRALHQAEQLDSLLRQHGAEPLSYPCIEMTTPEDTKALDDALRRAASGDIRGLILTSANTVFALENRLRQLGLSANALAGIKAAAIGPKTADEAVNHLGVTINIMPDAYDSEALFEALSGDADSLSLLLPQSDIADSALAERLRQRGADVNLVPAYRTVVGSGGVDLPALLAQGKVDAITFTSGSTVVNCFARLKATSAHMPSLDGVAIACIGPKTADVARELGLTHCIVPSEQTVEALISALDAHFLSLQPGALPK